MDREKIIKGLEQFRADFKPFCGNRADWDRFDAGLALLKEQEEQKRRWLRTVTEMDNIERARRFVDSCEILDGYTDTENAKEIVRGLLTEIKRLTKPADRTFGEGQV